ncbi:MAG: teichuronic acid biosynthesis glycosyltransferase TuaC [Parcubacteria bacterium C7867-005]|nr:MAG: teichuronic acid biosynthesis glycosyltransferase TuaC [Parcubacteria bacterium C7867-005]
MKLIYIANIRLPTEKAHGIQIMEMCSAFVQSGADLTLVIPNRKNSIKEDPFGFYQIKTRFHIVRLPVIDFGSSYLAFLLTTLTFFISLFFFLLFKKGKDTVLYTRGEVALALVYLFPKKIFFWETHSKADNMERYKKVIDRASGVVTVTKYYGEELIKDFGLPREKLIVESDAADVEKFDISITKIEAQQKLGLPTDKKIVLYKGHLYDRKGAHTLAQAAPLLRKDNIICVFIGGTEEDVVSFKERFGKEENVLILGNRPRQETPFYQKASDILVIPNSAKEDNSVFYTSPIKLFSYMAGKLPIVASDLPSLREILNEENAVFFKPDDAKDLAEKIQKVFSDDKMAQQIANKAFLDVQDHTWVKRGQRIIDFMKNSLKHD